MQNKLLEDALHLIITKCPSAFRNAVDCLKSLRQAPDSPTIPPMVVHRFNMALGDITLDERQDLTEEERTLIGDAALAVDNNPNRTLDIRLRVDAEEKVQVQNAARQAGMTVSDYMRQKLGLQGTK